MTLEPPRAAELPALTGLRAFAALAVVAWHLRELAYRLLPGTRSVAPWLDAGLLGVDVFFVLSGFVIAHTYASRLAERSTSLRDYFVARLARVYPVHLATLFGVGLLAAFAATQGRVLDASVDYTVLGFAGNLFMLQALPGIPAWNVPAWSISCEFAAYLVFPLLAARLLRLRPAAAAALVVVVLLVSIAAMVAVTPTASAVHAYYWLKIAGEFSAGALLWVVWRHRSWSGGRSALLACAAIVATLALLWVGLPWLLVTPPLVLVIPALASATGPVAAVFTHAVTRWGGRVSYSLYLVHSPLIAAALLWVIPVDAYDAPPVGVALLVLGGLLVASIAVAALVHHLIEEPARRMLRARLSARGVHGGGRRGLVDAR